MTGDEDADRAGARLRALGYQVAYYENVEGGHAAAADNEQEAFVSALTFQFLRRCLGSGYGPTSTGRRSASA